MKKLMCLYLFTSLCCSSKAQYDERPSRSRFWNTKLSTFTIAPGDTLVYNISKGDTQYNYIVAVKRFGSDITFDFDIPEQSLKGTVTIEAGAVNNASKYDTLNSAGSDLTDKSILWLSRKNYLDLWSDRATAMDFGNGNETFERKSTGTVKIMYKSKEKIITIYNIESKNGKTINGLSVLSNEKNPLILQMNGGYTMTLKEVR